MSLVETIDNDLKTAMKARESVRVGSLRMLRSELKNRQIDLGRPLEDGDVQAVLRTMIKQRRESIEAYSQGGRAELAAQEEAEMAVLQAYLPAELDDAAIGTAVREALAGLPEAQRQYGPLMGAVMKKLQGQADGKRIAQVVKAVLES